MNRSVQAAGFASMVPARCMKSAKSITWVGVVENCVSLSSSMVSTSSTDTYLRTLHENLRRGLLVAGDKGVRLVERGEECFGCLRIGINEALQRKSHIERDLADHIDGIDHAVDLRILQFEIGKRRRGEVGRYLRHARG